MSSFEVRSMERGSFLVSTKVKSPGSSSIKKTLIVSPSEISCLLDCTLLIFTDASVDLTELSEHISLKTLHNH